MSIRWLTSSLGTASYDPALFLSSLSVVDIRDLVDKQGNNIKAVRRKIDDAVELLNQGKKVVICCDYGISRSNAVAVGVIAIKNEISFFDALGKFIKEHPMLEIKTELLNAVKVSLSASESKNVNHDTRKVLLTGASGAIGRALKGVLPKEYTVFSPSRDELNVEFNSTELYSYTCREQIDCIVHLANPRIYTSNIAFGQSLTMLRNIIDVCVSENIHLVYPSSWEVYSRYKGNVIADEALPLFSKGPYGDAKFLNEVMIEHHRATRNLKCTLLRSSPVYSCISDKPKFIYNFAEKSQRGQEIFTHCYLNGDPALDLLAVEDFAAAFVKAIDLRLNDNFNIGTGVITSTFDIAYRINEYFGSKAKVSKVRINDSVANVIMDISKAQTILNWSPVISFDTGLKPLLDQYRRSFNS